MESNERTAVEIQAELDQPTYPVYTFPIDDFKAGVISKAAVVRHWQKLNPSRKIIKVGAFKIHHEEETVTLELKTEKKMGQLPGIDPDVIENLKARIKELEGLLEQATKPMRPGGDLDAAL